MTRPLAEHDIPKPSLYAAHQLEFVRLGHSRQEDDQADPGKSAQRPDAAARKASSGNVNTPGDISGPVVAEQQIGWWEPLRGRLPVDARTARVFVTRSGRNIVFPPDRQPTVGELLWQGVRRVYEVDTGAHWTRIETELPSRGDHFAFRAEIDLRWRAVDPLLVVTSGLTEVRHVLTPLLLTRLRAVTRRFDIRDAHQAENDAAADLADDPPGADLGLRVQVFIRFAMDDPTLEHAAVQRRVDQFRRIIAEGDFHQFALQLALKPDDIDTVIKELVHERDSSRAAVFDFVTRMLQSDALERWQVEDHVRAMLDWLSESSNKVLAGTDEARMVSFGSSSRESGTHGSGSRELDDRDHFVGGDDSASTS